MIDLNLYLGFVVATTVLMLIPGPNVALIVGSSVGHGTRAGLLTVAGTSSAVVVHLGVTALGMTAVLGFLAEWFEALRWIGVAYLVWLGVQQWRAAPADLAVSRPPPRSARATWTRGFLVSLTNPKVLLFYAAFFPQFIELGGRAEAQLLLLAATFLAIAVAVDSGWAVLGGRARGLLATRGRLRNRLSGTLMLGAGLGLALARNR
jgi:threonine/homoserine/homoserine lactone efflux protein